MLVEAGWIDEFQLRAACGDQVRWGGRLGRALVKLGFLKEEDLLKALAQQMAIPIARLHGKHIDPKALELVPRDMAEKHACIPLFVKDEVGGDVLYLGMEDPTDLEALDDLSFRTGLRLRAVLVGPTELRDALTRHYRKNESRPLRGPGGAEKPLDDTAPLVPEIDKPVPLVKLDQLLDDDTPPPSEPQSLPELVLEPPPSEPEASSETPRATPPDVTPAPNQKPREVPTRTILRALTLVLIERGLIGRDELIDRIRELPDEPAPSG